MAVHIDIADTRYRDAAAQILLRHDNFQPEANITSAVRDFLILTGLAHSEEIVEENPPSDTSRRAVDLTALDTFIEFKRRLGTAGGFNPDPAHVQQLDEYLELSKAAGKGVRMGVLTDGKYWLLRWPEAGEASEAKTARPYGFLLESADQWYPLYEWLRDSALQSLDIIEADRENVERYLGPGSPAYQRDIDTLARLCSEAAQYETIKVKRQLWENLLRVALGEIAQEPGELDDLFIRHTYLSLVIGMAVQASFGIDLRQVAENDPSDLLQGRRFRDATGLSGIIESDFFAWPDEVGCPDLLRTLARRVARFDWPSAPADIAAILYETVIPPEERRTLGEYYTPAWLARAMVRELVEDPLHQRVLDPACGSGTFIAEAVGHFLEAAGDGEHLDPKELLDKLRETVTGIDVHPVAVHLARAAWALAARPAIDAAVQAGYDASGSVPVYLGDALQLRFRAGDMFAEQQVTIQVEDEANSELTFPVSLVERADNFDSLMSQVAGDIERGDDPILALDDHGIRDANERQTLADTIAILQRLHDEGRDHIWAYYTRNLVRPVALSRARVDVVIGNPPWLNYNQTVDILRDELLRQGRSLYGIWVGRHYTTHQDVAGLFFARSVDVYLKDRGKIGMVLPHSALRGGHYAGWRTGEWQQRSLTPSGNLSKRVERTLAVDFGYKTPWDLEQLEPNSFFPMVSCVVFAERMGENSEGTAMPGVVEQWLGTPGSANVLRVPREILGTSGDGSPYGDYARQGASIVPRCLFFVNETENTAIVQAGQTITVNPRRGSLDKAPWRDLDLAAIAEQTVERRHLYDVYLGETLVPYATLEPLKTLLPLKKEEYQIPVDEDGPGGILLGWLEQRMRGRWQTISQIWDANKAQANRLDMLSQINYQGKLHAQLTWQEDHGGRPIRVAYSSSGTPTAAVLPDNGSIVDYTLFWIPCSDMQEANYLLAIINSDALYAAVQPLMAKGLFGARHLQKQLWRLPIPKYDAANSLHIEIAEAGAAAAQMVSARLEALRAHIEREGEGLTVRIARQESRAWLRTSAEGAAVEGAVGQLLGQQTNLEAAE